MIAPINVTQFIKIDEFFFFNITSMNFTSQPKLTQLYQIFFSS